MKIIDKNGNKDYYDYLVGIYGEDPKLILDRRIASPDSYMFYKEKIQLFIAGYVIDGYCDGDKIFYGEDLEQFKSKYKSWSYYKSSIDKKKNDTLISIDIDRYLVDFNKDIKKDTENINSFFDCPIILSRYNTRRPVKERETIKFPKLNELYLPKFLKAEDIFLMLSEWLSNKISEKEKIENTQTDVEKILSKGFDDKRSFRPNMK
jgi:hypothetical protein